MATRHLRSIKVSPTLPTKRTPQSPRPSRERVRSLGETSTYSFAIGDVCIWAVAKTLSTADLRRRAGVQNLKCRRRPFWVMICRSSPSSAPFIWREANASLESATERSF